MKLGKSKKSRSINNSLVNDRFQYMKRDNRIALPRSIRWTVRISKDIVLELTHPKPQESNQHPLVVGNNKMPSLSQKQNLGKKSMYASIQDKTATYNRLVCPTILIARQFYLAKKNDRDAH